MRVNLNKPQRLPSLKLELFTRSPFVPEAREWWSSIPAEAGWYAVETNAPHSALETLVPESRNGKHYDFNRRAKAAALLRQYSEIIVPSSTGQMYVVYSGECKNLNARAREHTHGNSGTACLALSRYMTLTKYKWSFLYRTCEEHVPDSNGDKLLRTLLEQRWRGEHGWPLLCTQ